MISGQIEGLLAGCGDRRVAVHTRTRGTRGVLQALTRRFTLGCCHRQGAVELWRRHCWMRKAVSGVHTRIQAHTIDDTINDDVDDADEICQATRIEASCRLGRKAEQRA